MDEQIYWGFVDQLEVGQLFDAALAEDEEILFACYQQECYEGNAWVLVRKGGTLYEVNGGHCSCMGLEGQWDLEETTVPYLQKCLEDDTGFCWVMGPTEKNSLQSIVDRL